MTPGGGFWSGALSEAGMDRNAFDIQYFPRWESQRHVFGTNGLVLMEASQNKDLAWEYMKYRVRADVMSNALGSGTSNPARRSLLTEERYASIGPEHWEVFYGTLDNYPDTAPLPAPPWFQEMNTIFTRYTDLAMTASESPQEALDNMQRDLEEAYANYEG